MAHGEGSSNIAIIEFEILCNRVRRRVVGTSSFLFEHRFSIQQPLLPLSFRFRRKPRQHQWHGLFLHFNADGIHHWF